MINFILKIQKTLCYELEIVRIIKTKLRKYNLCQLL